MSFVVTFEDWTPVPRYTNGDYVPGPWTRVEISEGPAETGPWSVIDAQDLVPVDADPAYPATRDFTTENAELEDGWYVLTFYDADNDSAAASPIHYPSSPEYRPSTRDVATLLLAYTRRAGGNLENDFTDRTEPTGTQVEEMIDLAFGDLESDVEFSAVPSSAYRAARAAVALRAAMYVVLSKVPEQVNQGGGGATLATFFERQYDKSVKKLEAAIVEVGPDGVDDTEDDTFLPGGDFSDNVVPIRAEGCEPRQAYNPATQSYRWEW